jgi:rod shape-determining protein MreC
VRSGTRSVAFGRGSTTQLELRYLPATADIQLGDELVTSGLGGRFPPDYPVAHVTAIDEDRVRGFVTVLAEPRARLDSSREVLVIKPRE